MAFFVCFFIFFAQAFASSLKVEDILIRGNQEIPSILISSLLTIERGEEFSFDALSSSYIRLKGSEYIKDVEIAPKIDDGKLYVEVLISEVEGVYELLKRDGIYTVSDSKNKKLPPVVSRIELEGNYSVQDDEVLKKIDLRVGSYYSLEKLELAKSSLERLGYFSKVWYTSFKSDDGIEVTFHFEENKFVGSEIKFVGNLSIADEELSKIIETHPNELMNTKLLSRDVSNIEKLYLERDIMGISVGVGFEGSNLVYLINEPVVGEISFRKHSHLGESVPLFTKDYVLRRHIFVKSGERLKKSEVNKSIRELSRLGLFRNITPELIPRSDNPSIRDIVFKLEEEMGMKANISAQGAFDGELKLNLMFEDKNFLGREYSLALSFDYDMRKRWKGRVYFFDPWVYGTNSLSYGVELYRTNESSKKDYGYFNNALLTGLALNFGFPVFGPDLRLSLKNDFKFVDQYDLDELLWDVYMQNTVSASLSLNLLNNYLDPTAGYYGNILLSWDKHLPRFGVEYENFGNKPDIISVEMVNRFYLPFISDINTVATRIAFGYSKFLSDKQVQFSNYSIGGPTTVRGYDTEALKGNFYFLLNLENRIAVYDKEIKLELLVFFDLGIAAFDGNINGVFDMRNYKKSFGLGFRLKRFLLPISFDLSFPFDEEEQYFRPEFSFGYTF